MANNNNNNNVLTESTFQYGLTEFFKTFNLYLIKLFRFPFSWKKAHFVILTMERKDPKFSQNTRPVSLFNCLRKICERILNRHLWQRWYIPRGKLALWLTIYNLSTNQIDGVDYIEGFRPDSLLLPSSGRLVKYVLFCTTVKHWKWCTWHRKASAKTQVSLTKFLQSEVKIIHIIV